MKHLQVLVDDQWKYVFAYSGETSKILTLDDDQKNKALPAVDLAFFQNKYGNHIFRTIQLNH